jgi:hypothetical protein
MCLVRLVMKYIVSLMVLILMGCGAPQDPETRTNAVPTGACRNYRSFGIWHSSNPYSYNPAIPGDLIFRDDCTIEHTFCNAKMEFVDVPDETFATNPGVRINVLETEGYAECPQLGEQTCSIYMVYLGTNNDEPAIHFECPYTIGTSFYEQN